MSQIRDANRRGRTRTSWLDSLHTFSFADYYDPYNMGFGVLRVINDDIVAPDGGFGTHHHDNMEILSIVLTGELEHRDSTGETEILKPGEVQRMTAGSGILHSEYNPSSVKPVHFLQIWITPNQQNLTPEYEQKKFSREKMHNKMCLIASQNGKDGSLKIHQNVKVYQMLLDQDKTISFSLNHERRYWFQVAMGSIKIEKELLQEGDGFSVFDETRTVNITGIAESSNIIVFDLP